MKDAGIVTICNLINRADFGDMPADVLQTAEDQDGFEMVYQFEERTVGYNRQYAAHGVGERVDMLIRTWRCPAKVGQYAVLTDYEYQENEQGDQFRIDNVQHTLDRYGLKVTDLTLYRLDQLYEVITEQP